MSYVMCNMFLMYLHTCFTYLHPTVAMGLNVKERLYMVVMSLFIFTTKTKILRERHERYIVSENLLTTHHLIPHGSNVPDNSQFHASIILLCVSTGRILKFIVFENYPVV